MKVEKIKSIANVEDLNKPKNLRTKDNEPIPDTVKVIFLDKIIDVGVPDVSTVHVIAYMVNIDLQHRNHNNGLEIMGYLIEAYGWKVNSEEIHMSMIEAINEYEESKKQ